MIINGYNRIFITDVLLKNTKKEGHKYEVVGGKQKKNAAKYIVGTIPAINTHIIWYTSRSPLIPSQVKEPSNTLAGKRQWTTRPQKYCHFTAILNSRSSVFTSELKADCKA